MKLPINGLLLRLHEFGFPLKKNEANFNSKLIQCFDGVHGLAFVINLNMFDQKNTLKKKENERESEPKKAKKDEEDLAFLESIKSFETFVNHQVFEGASKILFFNKIDLFKVGNILLNKSLKDGILLISF